MKEDKVRKMSDEKLRQTIWKVVEKAKPRAKSAFEKVMAVATREEIEGILLGNLRVTDGGGIGYGTTWVMDSSADDKA